MREEGAQWLNRLTHFYKREIYPPNLQYQELKEGTLRAFAKVRRAGEVLPIRRKNNWYFSGVREITISGFSPSRIPTNGKRQ